MGKAFFLKTVATMLLAIWFGAGALAQKTPMAPPPRKPATAPANETRFPAPVRSVHSLGKDWEVPMCPSHFRDSLAGNGIAGPHDTGVTRPTIRESAPAEITQQAIAASGKTHIGNYIVIVNVVVGTTGIPTDLCLQKSSGYGLDAASASAVSRYRFHAARKNGKPVRMRIPVEVRFENPIVG